MILKIFLTCLISYAGLNAISISKEKNVMMNVQHAFTVPEAAQKFGYPCEEHTVTTPDGYLLKIHRIPMGAKERETDVNRNKPVVLLEHGAYSSSLSWLLNPIPENSLALSLADEGFDVWLGNTRGSVYANQHVSLDPTSNEFWNFTLDEIAMYDIPATIDYVHKFTKRPVRVRPHEDVMRVSIPQDETYEGLRSRYPQFTNQGIFGMQSEIGTQREQGESAQSKIQRLMQKVGSTVGQMNPLKSDQQQQQQQQNQRSHGAHRQQQGVDKSKIDSHLDTFSQQRLQQQGGMGQMSSGMNHMSGGNRQQQNQQSSHLVQKRSIRNKLSEPQHEQLYRQQQQGSSNIMGEKDKQQSQLAKDHQQGLHHQHELEHHQRYEREIGQQQQQSGSLIPGMDKLKKIFSTQKDSSEFQQEQLHRPEFQQYGQQHEFDQGENEFERDSHLDTFTQQKLKEMRDTHGQEQSRVGSGQMNKIRSGLSGMDQQKQSRVGGGQMHTGISGMGERDRSTFDMDRMDGQSTMEEESDVDQEQDESSSWFSKEPSKEMDPKYMESDLSSGTHMADLDINRFNPESPTLRRPRRSPISDSLNIGDRDQQQQQQHQQKQGGSSIPGFEKLKNIFSGDQTQEQQESHRMRSSQSNVDEDAIFYIGYAQNSLTGLMALSKNPALAQKIKLFIGISTIGTGQYAHTPLMKLLKTIDLDDVFPQEMIFMNPDERLQMAQMLCTNNADLANVVFGDPEDSFYFFGGENKHIDRKNIPFFAQNLMAGTSKNVMKHFGQILSNNRIKTFDSSLLKRGTSKLMSLLTPSTTQIPTEYDLHSVVVPVVLITGEVDAASPPQDNELFVRSLPNVVDYEVIKGYGHYDFLLGNNCREAYVQKIIDLLKED